MAASKSNLDKKNQGHLDREDAEKLSDKIVGDVLNEEEDEEEIVDDDYEAPLEDDDFIADDDDPEEVVLAEQELTPKDQDARSLAIRRAIERRMEQKKLDEDLDYLDLDTDA